MALDLEDTSMFSSVVTAADTHNIANNNSSFFDTVTLGTGAVLGSAITQTLNILPTIGNLLGGDFEQIKTKEVLQDFDSDLGKYYEQHQEGVDALGFALSSIVPGSLGVKALKAGQVMLRGAAESGTIGANLSAATGILAPSQPKLLAAAVEAAIKPNAGFPVWNSATIKAIATGGFAQSVLEGAAFETAIAATMYNSPVLKEQDFGDIISNIAFGAGAFGLIGGAIHTAKTYSTIKTAAKEVYAEASPWNVIEHLSDRATHSERLVSYFDQLHSMPEVVAADYAGEQSWKAAKFADMRQGKVQTLQTKIRSLANDISGGDSELGQSMYDHWMSMSASNVESKIFSTVEYTRLSTKTEAEIALDKASKKFAETGDINHILNTPDRAVVYSKIAGEGIGKTVSEAPQIVNIADSLRKGESYTEAVSVYNQRLTKKWSPFESDTFKAEARYVTAAKHEFKPGEVIDSFDLPYLQQAYLKGIPEVRVKVADGSTVVFGTSAELKDFLITQKQVVAAELTAKKMSFPEISKITDIKEELLGGLQRGDIDENVFLTKTGEEFSMPQWAKTVKDLTPVKDSNGNLLDGLVAIKQKQVQYEEAKDRTVAGILGPNYKGYRISDKDILKANPIGPGGGMVSSQNENLGTLAMNTQFLGSQTLAKIREFQTATRELLTSDLYKIANKPDAAIEFSTLNAKLRNLPETYGLSIDSSGNTSLRPLKLIDYEAALAKGEKVTYPEIIGDISIPIRNAEAATLARLHIEKNGSRINSLAEIRANQGIPIKRDPRAFYPIPVNTKDYPHFAFVVDKSIGGQGHSKMLYAATSEELEKQITEIKAIDPTLKLYTKKEAETYYKAIGQFKFERTLTDTSFDAGLKRKGVSSALSPSTDPQKIVSDFLNWHLARDAGLVREAVAHQNEAQIATLRDMGERYATVKESHFSKMDPLSYLEMQGASPYADYVRNMLGLSTKKDFPFWTPVNDMLDRKVSEMYAGVRNMFAEMKTPAELESINKSLQDSGYEGAYYTAALNAHANHTAPKGALTAFIAKANSLLSIGTLGLDPINAVTNTVGSTVLRNTELQSLVRAIAEKDSAKAGELAHIKVPGTDSSIFSPGKMIARAMKDFTSPEGKALREELKSMGIISSRADQTAWVLDNLALTGKESVGDLNSKINTVFSGLKAAAAKGETLTGNKLAEEFNRFVSAHVSKQITGVAIEQGLIDSKQAWAYTNTFVNRVEGNYLASQRPGVFQGPIGQAVGLFQTYQFNLLQQLFRHVGEGSGKDVAMMMGLQSTIFGMKGLPAFDAINTHLIGNASGNANHRDLYDTIFGAAGKEAGDWLMYGVGSNALGLISPDLKFNLYTRGDINPRNVTLIPVNPANIPFVQASEKLYSSLAETANKIASGGQVWGSLLQGIEHAGVNRPLAGLAQSLEAFGNPNMQSYSTSSNGNVVASNDFLSLANMTRIAGAKPLDEAIGMDKAYNLEVYAAKDTQRRNALGETIKSTVIAGNHPSQDQIDSFSYQYAKAGGKQDKFAQFMVQQYKNANQSQVNKLSESLKSPFSKSMQTVMGGTELKDFTNSNTSGE
jgi:hypothetical protein